MSEGLAARLSSVQALVPVLRQQASLSSTLPKAQQGLATDEAALTQALAFGVCRFYPRLNYYAGQLLQKPLKSRDTDVLALLLVGLYQLQEGRVADYAAIDTCVEASKKLKKPWASKLLNACLRRFQREQTELEALAMNKESPATAHPPWLLKKIKKAYPQDWQQICEANNQQPPMTLRVNQRHLSREDYLQQLQQAGIEASATPASPYGILLKEATSPLALPGFADGWFSVQDEAAQLAPWVLDVQDGQRVLDACCAPGGKTTHLAESADIQLLALDSEEKRLPRVYENLKRLGLTAEVKCADAADPDSWWDGQAFDRILLDAPCSATGVIRRHPDIKLLRRESDIQPLAEVQLKLLQALWPLLKPGGKLVYATCSILPEENAHPLASFTHQQKDAQVEVIEADWGQATRWGRQLLPRNNGHDGFFYSLLIKGQNS
ncbi:16S rRNA (cytosine(967)-C(5))-methyltransferase RsmB [Marinospirillum sp.]|uniref:16S rRNA (cytosine(967)-C(5))-methyltransferase RsmB n=1 Tax=Marinospirillum sp. TaxID=2183934 RepID=UPI002870611A|nr:16S rRNA (cytosine(967)-C(5))-methyltransferase RsmB [Marinospirillum sp.]MDR9468555.1 16S rRNA (cytosine(967)-C(5))-methyltransferase RsmB [Marinospirillum sp.]